MASVATLRDLLEALIDTADGENKTRKVTADIVSFYDVITAEETLKKILGSSAYETSERIAIINDLGEKAGFDRLDRKSTRLNSSHMSESRMPSSA